MSHEHATKKTHISFIEFDDVMFSKLAGNTTYFGEGNSKERKMEFDFEYCLTCNFRLLDGQPIMTRDILEEEFEKFVKEAKKGNYLSSKQITVQHSDFEVLQRLIKSALAFGKLQQTRLC